MMPRGALHFAYPQPRPLGKAHSKLGLFYYIFLCNKIVMYGKTYPKWGSGYAK